jgi:hypothetical protein
MDDLHSPAFEVLTVHSDCSVHFRHGAEFDETSAHCFPADWVIENVDEAFGNEGSEVKNYGSSKKKT